MQDEETLTEMGLVVDQWLRTAEIMQYSSIHQQSMSHISSPHPKAGLDITQSYPLCRMCFGQ